MQIANIRVKYNTILRSIFHFVAINFIIIRWKRWSRDCVNYRLYLCVRAAVLYVLFMPAQFHIMPMDWIIIFIIIIVMMVWLDWLFGDYFRILLCVCVCESEYFIVSVICVKLRDNKLHWMSLGEQQEYDRLAVDGTYIAIETPFQIQWIVVGRPHILLRLLATRSINLHWLWTLMFVCL